jgi:hypothetical protein
VDPIGRVGADDQVAERDAVAAGNAALLDGSRVEVLDGEVVQAFLWNGQAEMAAQPTLLTAGRYTLSDASQQCGAAMCRSESSWVQFTSRFGLFALACRCASARRSGSSTETNP